MKTVEFQGWRVDIDPEANRRAYALVTPSAEECGCSECRNYAVLRDRGLVFPPEVIALLEDMGVDPSREAEVYGMGWSATEPGLYPYEGWFNVIGALLTDEVLSAQVTSTLQLFPLADPALPQPAFADASLFRLEFQVALPWVLDEASPDGPCP